MSSSRSDRAPGRTNTVVVVRSAAQRVALHVDEVLGNQEVVVKNLGPQLARVPGMAGISVLASGAVALIYNPVALAALHGAQALQMQAAGGVAAPARAICTARAVSTRARTVALHSPLGASGRRSEGGSRGTSICRSMRSSSGPEIRPR